MHKKIISLILLIALVSFACKKSDYQEVNQYSIEQFMNTVSIGGSSFSADETKILFSSNQNRELSYLLEMMPMNDLFLGKGWEVVRHHVNVVAIKQLVRFFKLDGLRRRL